MPKYKRTSGEEYNIPQDQVEIFLSTYPDAVEITNEIQTEPKGKTSDVATVDAAVTSEPDAASESTESDSVDTSGELQPGEQGYFRQERRKGRSAKDIRSGVIKPEASKELTFEEEFAVDVTSPSFNDLTPDQLQDIQDEAITQLTSQYSDEESFDFDETDVRLKAISIFENKVLPKVSLEKDTKLETFIKEKAPILNPYADFISDLYTSWKQGFATSKLVDPTFELLKKGSDTPDKDIVNWIEANKKVASENMQSDEMRDFNRIYEENGSGIFGFIKGVASNPSVMPSLLVSSFATQLGSLRSEEVAGAAALGAGTGAGLGAAAGTLGGPLAPITSSAGAVTGAISGGIAAGAGAMEASLTFSELLQEEVGEDLSLEAVKELFNDEERVEDLQRKAINRGIAIGLVEGLTGGIAKGVTGKALKAGLSKPVASAAGIAVESVGGGTGEVAGRVAAGQEMDIAEIGFEAITGTTTAPITVGSELLNLNNGIANYQINKELKNTEFNNIEQAFNPEATTTEAQIKISQNKRAQDILDTQLKRSVVKGDITQEQADNTKKNFRETQGAVNSLKPLKLNDQEKSKAVELIKEKKKLLQTIKEVGEPALTEKESQRIKEIDNSFKDISKKTTTAKGADVIAEQLGISLERLSTQEEVDARKEQLKKENKNLTVSASASYGNAYTLDDGSYVVLINEQIANEDNVYTTEQHEILHPLMNQTFANNPDAAIAFGKSLIAELNNNPKVKINRPDIQQRIQQYQKQGKPTAEIMEEVLNFTSEGLSDGSITIEESTLVKIGNYVRKFLRDAGVLSIKFNSGKDVLSFIRDYNTTIEKGKGLGKAAKAVATEGAKGKLVTETTTETTAGPTESASLRIYQEVESQKEDLINPETKASTALIIANDLENEVDRRLNLNIPAEDKADIVRDFIADDTRGLTGLLLKYDENRNDSIMGYLNSSTPGGKLLDARLIEFYQDDPRYKNIIQSTTDEAVQRKVEGIITEETSIPQAEVVTRKPIDSRTFGPAAGVSIDDIVTIKQGQKPSFRELAEQNLDEVSTKVFNVPGKKIRGNATLTDAEAKSLQRLFVDPNNVRKLIKTMPPYNVAGSETVINEQGETIDVSRDVKGKSIGLSSKFIKKYYQPVTRAIPGISNAKGRSLGLTTQTQVYELKPEYTGRVSNEVVKQIQNDVGVTESGVPNQKISAENRSKYGTTLTGFSKAYLANAINAAGRGKQTTKQEQADTGAGKSRDAASLRIPVESRNSFVFSDVADFDFASNAKDWKKILKTLGIKSIDMSTETGRQEFLNTAIETGLTKEIPESVWLTLGGTSERFVDEAQGVYYDPSLKAAVTKEGFQITTDIGAGLRDYKRGLPFRTKAEAEVWIAESKKAGVKFAPETEASKAMAEKFGYNKKNDLSKKLNDSDFVKQQDLSLQGLKDLFNTFEKYINQGSNKKQKAAIIAVMLGSTSAHQGHFMRVAAPVRFYQEGYLDGPKGETMVEEHTLPATILAKYLFLESYDGKVNKAWPNVEKNYFQGALLKESDLKLKGRSDINEKAFNYTEKTPQGWQMSDNIWARYFNMDVASNRFGIDPNTIKLTGGKSVFDIYNVDATGSRISDASNLSRQKASVVNNSKIIGPTRERSSLRRSMPNTLDNMSNLDADAKQANKQFYDSLDLDKEFNDILEVKTGIASEKRYKRVKAEVVGANKGRFQFFIPPSAEDFTGLLYSTLAKGKLGDAQMAWYKKNLLDPYGKAMNELSSARIAMMNDYKALKKELKLVPKDLRKKVPGEPFTQEQAVRVYIWQKQGMSVPGISETDMKDLSDFVEGKEDLKTFADQLMYIQKGDQYAGPKEGWPAGTITTDMLEGLNTIKRAKALEQWQANADEIFSETNLNKLEAAYGKPYRKAMENMLQRMKSGRNRNFQGDTLTGRFTDWVTGSIGTIMFFNTRSALLQTISSINFVNFTDNNVLAAGKAFANQKQYWSDFMTLMNSDFLKERRGGLRINVSEADIADMAKKGGAKGVINKLLEFGFTPTQIADSFAIASGGATFYRNRIKSLKKQGMTDAEAEAQAFVDFRETAEESQQSSRPDRISMQQAGPLGRLVLAFANTPAQYARLIKKAASDLKNGRGDAKTNISKIIYYGVAQNLLFNALQQALFAFAFDDDEEDTDEQQKKYVSIANGMMDSLLRGMGLGGAVLSVGKNAIKRIIDEMEKKQPKLEKVGYEITKLSPPISAKLSRINQAARSYQWDKKEMMEKGWSLDNPAYLAGANVVSALTNIPLDRAVKKTNNVVQATSQDLETWERLALLGGWQDWEIGIDKEPEKKKKKKKTSQRGLKERTLKER